MSTYAHKSTCPCERCKPPYQVIENNVRKLSAEALNAALQLFSVMNKKFTDGLMQMHSNQPHQELSSQVACFISAPLLTQDGRYERQPFWNFHIQRNPAGLSTVGYELDFRSEDGSLFLDYSVESPSRTEEHQTLIRGRVGPLNNGAELLNAFDQAIDVFIAKT